MHRLPVFVVAAAVVVTACSASGPPPGGDGGARPIGGTAAAASPSAAGPVAGGGQGPTGAATPGPVPTGATTATGGAPQPPTLQGAFEKASAGVVRFEVVTCGGYTSGTGFLVPGGLVPGGLVVTAGHVVGGAPLARVIRGTTAARATLVGIDEGQDIAAVRTAAPLGGTTQSFAAQPPRVGDPVATVGFSLGGQLAFHPGTVNGLDRKVSIDGRTASGLIEHDAAALPGDSGAPLVDLAGNVVGIHGAGVRNVAGQRFAVPSTVAAPLVARWGQNPRDLPGGPPCPVVYGFNGEPLDISRFPAPNPEALQTLVIYASAINNGDYATAAAQFLRSLAPADLAKGTANSSLSRFVVKDMRSSGGRPVVWLQFVSTQPAGKGPAARPQETCTVWSQDYLFGQRNGLWLIDRTQARPGVTRNQPCR